MTGSAQIDKNRNSHYRQVILLDKNGIIKDSCDSLFDANIFKDTSIGNYFYFLASELPTILASEADKITYNQMQTTQKCLPGFYDFVFSKVTIDEKVHILWEIFDYTKVYKEYVKVQQIKNEIDIHEQFLSRQKELSTDQKKAHSENFFQSEYIAKQKVEKENLVYQLIHNKRGSEAYIGKSKEDLVNLRGHLESMIKEINQFLDQVKEEDQKVIAIRDLVDDFLLTIDPNFSDKLTVIYNDTLPKSVCINKKVLNQLISLICKDGLSRNDHKNASLSLGEDHEEKDGNSVMSLNYIEQLSPEANLNDDSTKRVIKLTILNSLVTTLGGTLLSKYSSDNHLFGVIISLPLKNC